MDEDRKTRRRAVVLFACYVLLTTLLAAVVVEVGVRAVIDDRAAVDAERGREPGAVTVPVPGRSSPRPSPTARRTATPTPTRPTRTPAAVVPPPTRAPTRAPTRRPTPTRSATPTPKPSPKPTPTPTSTAVRLYLKTSGPGDRVSQPVLPLSAAGPSTGTLRNYDTNRDAKPGLLLRKGGEPVGESDSRKYQAWSYTAPAAMRVRGQAAITVWWALQDFRTKGRGRLRAALLDCSAGGSCRTLAQTSLTRSTWSGTWVRQVLSFGGVDTTIAAGRRLRVVVAIGDSSVSDGWLAYDTTAFPAGLRVA